MILAESVGRSDLPKLFFANPNKNRRLLSSANKTSDTPPGLPPQNRAPGTPISKGLQLPYPLPSQNRQKKLEDSPSLELDFTSPQAFNFQFRV